MTTECHPFAETLNSFLAGKIQTTRAISKETINKEVLIMTLAKSIIINHLYIMSNLSEFDLTDREFQVLQSELKGHERSTGIAYLLWFFFGGIGMHKFYIGSIWMGLLYPVLVFIAIFGMGTGLIVLVPLLIYDAFTIPKQIERKKQAKKHDIIERIESR